MVWHTCTYTNIIKDTDTSHRHADFLGMWPMHLPICGGSDLFHCWTLICRHLEILSNYFTRNLDFYFVLSPGVFLYLSKDPLMKLRLPFIKFYVYLGGLESILSKIWIQMHDFNQDIDFFTCQQGYIYLKTHTHTHRVITYKRHSGKEPMWDMEWKWSNLEKLSRIKRSLSRKTKKKNQR